LDDCQSFNCQTAPRLNSCSLDLVSNWPKYSTPHSAPPTLLAILASSLMNTFPFPIRSQLALNPAIITFVNFVASVLTSISKQPLPLPPPSSTPNLTTVTLFTIIYTSLNLPPVDSEFSCTFCHITSILHSLHWLKITERIEYKILYLTYKVLTTAQPSYLHYLITVQPYCSARSSSVITQSHPPSLLSLQITDWSFHYVSPHLWNQLPASLRQPHAGLSMLDSNLPTHVSSVLSINSQLSSSITPSLITLSVPAQNLPLSQILPTIGPISFSGTDLMDCGCELFVLAYPVLFWFCAVD